MFSFCVLCSWFHPNADRHIAESLLMQNGEEGSYLLRHSKNAGDYSLSVRYNVATYIVFLISIFLSYVISMTCLSTEQGTI